MQASLRILLPLLLLPCCCTCTAFSQSPPATTQPATNPGNSLPPDLADCTRNLRDLASALATYADTHNHRYPISLGPTLDIVTRIVARSMRDHQPLPSSADIALKYRCPLAPHDIPIPDPLTPDWVRQNTTYGYLGSDQLSPDFLSPDQQAHTILLHDDLNHPHKHPTLGPVIPVAYLNGSIQLLPPDQARKQIESSKQTLASAIKKSAPTTTSPSNP